MLKKFLLAPVVFIVNCQDPGSTPSEPVCSPADLMSQHDLTLAPTKCAAAQGLSGDVLLCVDFDKVAGLDQLAITGWDFNYKCGDNVNWDLINKKLQIRNFNSLKSDCRFTLPEIDLSSAKYQKIQEVNLIVKQSLDINKAQQVARIYLGGITEDRQIWQSYGGNPPQTFSIKIERRNLPNGGGSLYKPLFFLNSGFANEGINGWVIESIAVIGSTAQ